MSEHFQPLPYNAAIIQIEHFEKLNISQLRYMFNFLQDRKFGNHLDITFTACWNMQVSALFGNVRLSVNQ